MARQPVTAHYELYALREGRWVMDACFADEAEAQEEAQRTRRAHDVRGVRVVRELTLPDAATPVVTVLYDSTQKVAAPAVASPPAAVPAAAAALTVRSAPTASHRPRLHLDDAPRSDFAVASRDRRLVYAVGATGFVMVLLAMVLALS